MTGLPGSSDRQGRLIVVSAPSGAGKTSLVRALLETDPELRFSISCTTREPRNNETDGLDYHFLSEAEFRRQIESGEFLEHADVFGNLYGTRRADVEAVTSSGRELILEIDYQGAMQVIAAMPEALTIFILPPSRDEQELRLRGRGTDAEPAIQERLAGARREIEHWEKFRFVVVNDDFDRAVAEIQAIIGGDRPPGIDPETRETAEKLLA